MRLLHVSALTRSLVLGAVTAVNANEAHHPEKQAKAKPAQKKGAPQKAVKKPAKQAPAKKEAFRLHGVGMFDIDVIARIGAECVPGGFRQAGVVLPEQIGMHHVERCEQALSIHSNVHAGSGCETFRLADMAVRAHVDDVLAVGVDPEPLEMEMSRACRPGHQLAAFWLRVMAHGVTTISR